MNFGKLFRVCEISEMGRFERKNAVGHFTDQELGLTFRFGILTRDSRNEDLGLL